MSAWDAVLLLAAVAAVGGTGAAVQDLRWQRPAPARASLALPLAAAGLALAALLFLADRFLAADLSYESVFFYTRIDLDWPWRLAGTWAGREGSLLLWATATGVAAAALAWSHRRETGDAALDRARAWTRVFMGILSFAFLWGAWQQSPFGATPAALLEGRPMGNGLNPVLRSGFILIHPPLMFAAYAISAVPAAAALGALASGHGSWSRVALQWTRAGWLLMTAALALGAMWAYITLGFGGYFAWDPVEVANLLPWIAFTVLLHAQLHHLRHGSYARIGPFLGVLPLLFTLFSTISTRSGLWVSVHAFTDPTDTFNPDAAARFLDILRVEPSLNFYVALFLAVLAATLGLWSRSLAAATGRLAGAARVFAAGFGAVAGLALVAPASAFSLLLAAASRATGGATGLGLLGLALLATALAAAPLLAARDEGRPSAQRGWRRVNLRTLNAYSVLALGLALLVLFLLHVAAVNGWTTAFYEHRFPFLAAPVALGLFVLLAHGPYGARAAVLGAACLLALAGAAQAARPDLHGGAFLGVLALGVVAVGVDRVRRAASPAGRSARAVAGAVLLWVAALLDVLFWVAPPEVVLGPLRWAPPPVASFALLGASLAALAASLRVLLAHPPRPAWLPFLAAGLLGGFYVAAPLAAVAWYLARGRPAALGKPARARLRQAALYGAHLAMGVLLLGYAASTYGRERADAELAPGQSAALAGMTVTYVGTPAPGGFGEAADTLHPAFSIRHGDATIIEGTLHWEVQAGSYFPLPSVLHLWDRDVYLDADAVHVAPRGACSTGASGAWIEAYKAGADRVCGGDVVDGVRFSAVSLPGIGLVWLGALLLVCSMLAIMVSEPRPPPAGQATPATPATPAPDGDALPDSESNVAPRAGGPPP